MRVELVLTRPQVIVSVIFLQFAGSFAYNLHNTDLNVQPDITVQTITINTYDSSKPNLRALAPDGTDSTIDQSPSETWSVVWYIASFGGLILFFLIVSCSEWCCRRNARRNCQRTSNPQTSSQAVLDTPPPSYDLFAPPAYEDLWVGSSSSRRGEKSEYDIYVVPVHALGTIMEEARREDAPPSYQSASANFVHPSDLPQVHTSHNSST